MIFQKNLQKSFLGQILLSHKIILQLTPQSIIPNRKLRNEANPALCIPSTLEFEAAPQIRSWGKFLFVCFSYFITDMAGFSTKNKWKSETNRTIPRTKAMVLKMQILSKIISLYVWTCPDIITFPP